jgi:hypothetical protein
VVQNCSGASPPEGRLQEQSEAACLQWGTGVDLYFISLKFFAIIFLMAGLINTVLIK